MSHDVLAPVQPMHTLYSRRNKWLKNLYQWHWISSAISLLGILIFAFTGITLNHAGEIEATPVTTHHSSPLPSAYHFLSDDPVQGRHPLPAEITIWIKNTWGINTEGQLAEWSQDEIYLSMPRPGGDSWLRIDLESHDFEYELTTRGWIAYLNDLHKGRHTGTAWRMFIDFLSIACLIFAITGLLILKMHARQRPAVWPLTGLGIIIPILLALLFIH